MEVKVNIIPQITDAMVFAFEGGSNYWNLKAKYIKGCNFSDRVYPWYSYEDFWADKDFAFEIECDHPRVGDYTDAQTLSGTIKLTITANHFQNGLDAMACNKEMAKHLSDLVSGNVDAETGNILIQYAAFGRLVFG